jgi:putative transcriptional regulator
MSNIKAIRTRLGLTQTDLAKGLGCTQGNVGHYEIKGQTVPPEVARRLIAFAAGLGVQVTYDDIYGPVNTQPAQAPATAATPYDARNTTQEA